MRARPERIVILLIMVCHLTTASFSFRTPVKLLGGLTSASPSASSSPQGKSKDARKDSISNKDPEKREIILVVTPKWARFLYGLSALNPFLAVFFNDYSRMLEPFPFLVKTQSHLSIGFINLEGVFSVIRLRPRVSFAIGALLRALQLTTPFQYVLNPPVGVGFGLNVICLLANSRWPATIFLGWSLTGPIWKILGARAPSSSPVPITINFNTNKKKKEGDGADDDRFEGRQQRPTEIGYRIGL